MFDVDYCSIEAARNVVTIFIGERGFTVDGVDDNVSRWIPAKWIMGNELDAMKDGDPVEWDVKTSCSIFDLTF